MRIESFKIFSVNNKLIISQNHCNTITFVQKITNTLQCLLIAH